MISTTDFRHLCRAVFAGALILLGLALPVAPAAAQDRVAVILRDAEGRVSSPGGTGFSEAFLGSARELELARAGLRSGVPVPRDGLPRRDYDDDTSLPTRHAPGGFR